MTIAINFNQFIQSGNHNYWYDYFLNIAAGTPAHQFIFILPVSYKTPPVLSQNIVQLTASPKNSSSLRWKLWLDYLLPRILKKHNANLLINAGGVCSLRSKTPQYLIVSDLSFLTFPSFFSKSHLRYLNKNMPSFLNKATRILTPSDFITKAIIQQYSVDAEKIHALFPAADKAYQPAGWAEKEAVKEYFTEGKEYFLFNGGIHPGSNLVNLLKAFSFFKKRQKSNMQLVITAEDAATNDLFLETIKTYKYRNEVKILLDLPKTELVKITAAAYTFVYPALYEGIAHYPFRAMQCDVPAVTTNTGALSELMGNAAVYADPENFEDIAYKMMLVFKDETFRNKLIENGRLRIEQFKKENQDDQVWQSIVKLLR